MERLDEDAFGGYLPRPTEEDIDLLSHEMADLIGGRLSHSGEEMRSSARRMISPSIRLAVGHTPPPMLSAYLLNQIAHALSEYLYFAELGLPDRAHLAIVEASSPLADLCDRASREAGFLTEEERQHQAKVPGPGVAK